MGLAGSKGACSSPPEEEVCTLKDSFLKEVPCNVRPQASVLRVQFHVTFSYGKLGNTQNLPCKESSHASSSSACEICLPLGSAIVFHSKNEVGFIIYKTQTDTLQLSSVCTGQLVPALKMCPTTASEPRSILENRTGDGFRVSDLFLVCICSPFKKKNTVWRQILTLWSKAN